MCTTRSSQTKAACELRDTPLNSVKKRRGTARRLRKIEPYAGGDVSIISSASLITLMLLFSVLVCTSYTCSICQKKRAEIYRKPDADS